MLNLTPGTIGLAPGRFLDRRDLPALFSIVIVGWWVQRHALGAFFSSPDDLVHLQQAVGLKPVLPTPFRFLSQVLYFRLMVSVFGLQPAPFHIAALLLHLGNAILVFTLARSWGLRRVVSGAGAVVFAAFPLFLPLIASAVGINDELALTFALIALLVLARPGRARQVAACLFFLVGMLCKESVVCLSLLAAVSGPSTGRRFDLRRAVPLTAVSILVTGLFFLLRPRGLAPDSVVYAMELGPNVGHNLMTYLAWSINLWSSIPDLVSSYDPQAWRTGVWVALALLAGLVACRKGQPAIALGLVWWLLGLLPVLPLRFQTYRHYMYPAIPGLALAIVGVVWCAIQFASHRIRGAVPRGTSHLRGEKFALAVLAAFVAAYAVKSEGLIRERIAARVPGTDLALDPVIRRREVAQRALWSLEQHLPARDSVRVAVFSPRGTQRAFGARSGREYSAPGTGTVGYDLVRESLDGGWAVKLFFPQVDSIAFIDEWRASLSSFELFVSIGDGYLLGVGRGPRAHAEAAKAMLGQGWGEPTRRYMSDVVAVYPEDLELRLALAGAMASAGDDSTAALELERIIRVAPNDTVATAARLVLELMRARRP